MKRAEFEERVGHANIVPHVEAAITRARELHQKRLANIGI